MEKMKEPRVVIDITHYPHVNFYKNAIKILMKKGVNVDIIVRPRGNLTSILKKEYNNPSFKLIGKHKSSLFGKIYDLIERDIKFLIYLRNKNFDVATGVGSISLTHAAYTVRKPSVMFEDDVEYKLGFNLYKHMANHIVMPSFIPLTGSNILKYKGFKELAYLHPNHFKPNKKALNQYGVSPNEYIFIREVSNTSLNYKSLKGGKIRGIIKYLRNMGFKIVLSLEDKSLAGFYDNECIVLREPVYDIYSLLHFASLIISSGDSMARESCLVGTPAIYTGGRDMAINNELIKRSCMFKVNGENQIKDTIKYLIENEVKKEVEVKIKHAMKQEWVDTTEVILDILMGTIYEDDYLIEKYKS